MTSLVLRLAPLLVHPQQIRQDALVNFLVLLGEGVVLRERLTGAGVSLDLSRILSLRQPQLERFEVRPHHRLELILLRGITPGDERPPLLSDFRISQES